VVVRLLAPVDLLAVAAVPIAFFSAALLRSVDKEFGEKPLALTTSPAKQWTVAGRLKFAAAFLGGCTASSMFALWGSTRFF
jgi:hypothetical protein